MRDECCLTPTQDDELLRAESELTNAVAEVRGVKNEIDRSADDYAKFSELLWPIGVNTPLGVSGELLDCVNAELNKRFVVEDG